MDASPSKLRIKQLSEKLTTLQTGLEGEQTQQVEAFAQKLRALEGKIAAVSNNFSTRTNIMKDSAAKLSDELRASRTSLELLDEKKSKELKLVENNLHIDLNLLKQSRKETEGKLLRLLDEQVYSVQLDIAKERKIREQVTEQQTRQLEEHINQLNCTVQAESTAREEAAEKLAQHVQNEFGKFEEEFAVEKNNCEESVTSMIKMLGDMQERLVREVDNERQERQTTEETLLKLLEESCMRVENTLRSSVL